MPNETLVTGLFSDERRAASAIRALRAKNRWPIRNVHTPIPSHKIAEAMSVKKGRVGWCTLAGGILGFFFGFALAVFTASRWRLVVGGKPLIVLAPFFITGFEFAILFAVFGNILGLVGLGRLPDYGGLIHHDPHCTGDRFGVVVSCPGNQRESLAAFFRDQGAEVAARPLFNLES